VLLFCGLRERVPRRVLIELVTYGERTFADLLGATGVICRQDRSSAQGGQVAARSMELILAK